MKALPIVLALATSPLPLQAAADQSCPAPPPMAHCTAAAPKLGEMFSGAVLQVMEGDVLCVALGPTPDQWVHVRLVDTVVGVSRAQMMRAAFARTVDCVAVGREAVGVAGVCALDGEPLAKVAAAAPPPPDDPDRLARGAEIGL